MHSAKDLPTEIPPGLRLAGITKRESPYDCIIFREKAAFSRLKKARLSAPAVRGERVNYYVLDRI